MPNPSSRPAKSKPAPGPRRGEGPAEATAAPIVTFPLERSWRSLPRKGRRGGLLVIVAGGLVAMIGMGAMVVDVGAALAQRTRMQLAADAASLAAARNVGKSEGWAKLEAITIAKLNGYNIKGSDIHITTNPTRATVAWKEQTGMTLAPVFNILNVKVGVSSTAELVAIQEKLRVVPFIVPKSHILRGSITTMKYGPGDGIQGNYGAVSIDGRGAKIYQESIENGAKTEIKTGQFLDTEPGNMSGPTECGVQNLIKGDTTSYEDALVKSNNRLVVVPVVDDQDFLNMHGRSQPIMVRGFARFYLIGAKGGVVTGRFIDVKYGENAPPPQEMQVKLVR